MTGKEFEIKLPLFEGPFDLLLFFIERDELDIYDIPIARITDDFLGYIHQMTTLNMAVASEFIFVAATLMRIKAKMLLPRYAEESEEGADPKQELVQKLIEYKRFKTICEALRPLEQERLMQEKRGNIEHDLTLIGEMPLPGNELNSITLYKLMLTFDRLSTRWINRIEPAKHTVFQYPYTIEKQKEAITDLLTINKKIGFAAISKMSENKVQFVYNFLALLEMLQQQLIKLQQGSGYNNFSVLAVTT